jgi:hypothetical protein
MVKRIGGGAPSAPIYQYGVDNGYPQPPYHKGEYPTDRVTRKLPAPKGEDRSLLREDFRDAGRSKSGAYLAPAGKSDALGVDGRDRGVALRPAVQRGIPSGGAGARDVFNRRASTHELYASKERRDPGVAYKSVDGKTKYRGRSG